MFLNDLDKDTLVLILGFGLWAMFLLAIAIHDWIERRTGR
jgi:hypothetical protein